jgi:hypothetical protein
MTWPLIQAVQEDKHVRYVPFVVEEGHMADWCW